MILDFETRRLFRLIENMLILASEKSRTDETGYEDARFASSVLHVKQDLKNRNSMPCDFPPVPDVSWRKWKNELKKKNWKPFDGRGNLFILHQLILFLRSFSKLPVLRVKNAILRLKGIKVQVWKRKSAPADYIREIGNPQEKYFYLNESSCWWCYFMYRCNYSTVHNNDICK